MKIMEKNSSILKSEDKVFDVVGIYYAENKVFFLTLIDSFSSVVYSRDEVEIVESEINFKTVYFSGRCNGIYHWALIKENLLDGVIEGDVKQYKKFVEILKKEGLVNKDFGNKYINNIELRGK